MYETVYVSPQNKARLIALKKEKGFKNVDETVAYLVRVYEANQIMKPEPKGGKTND